MEVLPIALEEFVILRNGKREDKGMEKLECDGRGKHFLKLYALLYL